MARICFVAHYAFGAMMGGYSGHFGGVERQTSIMSHWFAAHGHRVTVLTWDEGQKEDLVVEGVRIKKICRRNKGIPGVRFFHPRWTNLIRTLAAADSDIYYHNCAEYVTGQVALWCQRHSRKFIYSVANDPDCDPSFPELKTIRERLLYRYGLKSADGIIVQTKKQQEMLYRSFGLNSIVLPMPCPGPPDDKIQGLYRYPDRPFRAVWAGRIARVKRLEFLLDVAEMMPDVSFWVAGKPDDVDSYVTHVIRRMKVLPNLTFLGAVQRPSMSDFYSEGSVLCCTSLCEGFPNTFLEAWSYGLPVVATVDPDHLIESRGMGYRVDTPDQFVECIQRLKDDSAKRDEMSFNARRYFKENHSVEPAMHRFETLFEKVQRGGGVSV
jgi:glycosyltransferase involved in cell wall biosynthesis